MRETPAANDRAFEPGVNHVLPKSLADAGDERRTVVLQSSSPHAIESSAERLLAGGVISLPTDTVYGVAASLAHESALQRVFEIKRRPEDRTLPVLIASTDVLVRIAARVSEEVLLLLDRYWPGPLTVVIPARGGMPDLVTGPGQTIGVRLPNHPLAIEVIDRAGGAIACTSANRSGESPARTAAEVAATMGPELDLILDGGLTPGGVPSTVIAVEHDLVRVLREGAIPAEHLLATWDELLRGA
ncbi:MAG: L-threonylcarbamoyladenylate synthase [Thermomicrobiales bacterium]|jgi:L-threonylcarbamoyladenylate synthase|nr:L-threonylcarbamoyladenylate synthase [Thermomicrobiales bacterium]